MSLPLISGELSGSGPVQTIFRQAYAIIAGTIRNVQVVRIGTISSNDTMTIEATASVWSLKERNAET
ncbi:MAG: hypothetical protein RMJ55_18545 [Roseiflexaceae bacterium]|nr:hypothetical protein [Roseiflexaceae bacterium]